MSFYFWWVYVRSGVREIVSREVTTIPMQIKWTEKKLCCWVYFLDVVAFGDRQR